MRTKRLLKIGQEIVRREIEQKEVGKTILKILAVKKLITRRAYYFITVSNSGKTFIYMKGDSLDNLHEDFFRLYNTYLSSLKKI